jgi:hypothetical protein
MLNLINQENPKHSAGFIMPLPKYNRMWGVDYLLMNSANFLKETSGNEYENITDMFCNIWNAYKYRVLENIRL